MSKKFSIATLIILSTVLISFSGCGGNNISFYFGTSDTCDGNVRLELNAQNEIEQKKEKIENSKLVFNPNDDGDYENMHLCFKGNNIESVVAESENKTIFYNHYDVASHCLDHFEFFYPIDAEAYEEEYDVDYEYVFQHSEQIMESYWDSGKFDDIRNVYFNGLSLYDINRFRRNDSDMIGAVSTQLYSEEAIEDCYEDNGFPIYYLDRKMPEEDMYENAPIVYTMITMQNIDGKPVNKGNGDSRDVIVQGEAVKTNPDVTEDSFIYRYEKLFYNSQQTALDKKDSFDYSDLVGETINITVNYTDESTQEYCLDISFDDNGNIIAVPEQIQ